MEGTDSAEDLKVHEMVTKEGHGVRLGFGLPAQGAFLATLDMGVKNMPAGEGYRFEVRLARSPYPQTKGADQEPFIWSGDGLFERQAIALVLVLTLTPVTAAWSFPISAPSPSRLTGPKGFYLVPERANFLKPYSPHNSQ